MKNSKLTKAKNTKNDEFYTQYNDIEKEIKAYLEFDPNVFRDKTVLLPCDDPEWSNFTRYFVQNFTYLGLKKLISTSFSFHQGKIFTLKKDKSNNQIIDLDNLKWNYLIGNGDFRSDEIRSLRDEADIIITNPPFSLFREFLTWVTEANKEFIVIANKNCITYKEVFPLIKENKLWSGKTEWSGGMWFKTIDKNNVDKVIDGINMKNISSIWITNLNHGKRYKSLELMTMEDNLKFNKKLDNKNAYLEYDNYKAIEVPFTNAIPSDYKGVMGVPISFLDKYNPEQFEIIGATESEGRGFSNGLWYSASKVTQPLLNGNKVYKRIFIKHISQ